MSNPKVSRMRRALALAGLMSVALAASLGGVGLPNAATQISAEKTSTFVIPANDGYGVGECLPGGNCGKVLADAWCEAQGFGRSVSFSMMAPEDVTGSVAERAAARPLSITCAP